MTQNSCKSYTFIWKIENFSLSNHKKSEFIESPHFTIETLNHSKWFIKFYPKGNSASRTKGVSVFLYRDDGNSAIKELIIHYKLDVVDGNGITIGSKEKKNIKFNRRISSGCKDFILRDTLEAVRNYWNENVLTIRCDISSEQYDEEESIVCGCNALTKIGFDKCVFEWQLNTSSLESPAWRKEKTLFHPAPIEIIVSAPGATFEIHIRQTKEFPSVSRPILCRFSLLNRDGPISVSKCDRHLFESSQSDVWIFPSFLTKNHLEVGKDDFVQTNTFTLKCEISISTGTHISYIESYMFQSHTQIQSHTKPTESLTPNVNLLTSLQNDLRNMFTLKKHCDIQLKFSDCLIPAHKAVLAARSPVFSAMFDQNMLENQTGVVAIDDVESSTMHDLLECIYTGSAKDLNYESASKLWIAADKYEILSLKLKCSEFLSSILSTSTVLDVLSMAAVIDQPLKTSAMDYIMKNFEKIMSSQTWSEWVRNNHDLTTEVFLTLSKCIKK